MEVILKYTLLTRKWVLFEQEIDFFRFIFQMARVKDSPSHVTSNGLCAPRFPSFSSSTYFRNYVRSLAPPGTASAMQCVCVDKLARGKHGISTFSRLQNVTGHAFAASLAFVLLRLAVTGRSLAKYHWDSEIKLPLLPADFSEKDEVSLSRCIHLPWISRQRSRAKHPLGHLKLSAEQGDSDTIHWTSKSPKLVFKLSSPDNGTKKYAAILQLRRRTIFRSMRRFHTFGVFLKPVAVKVETLTGSRTLAIRGQAVQESNPPNVLPLSGTLMVLPPGSGKRPPQQFFRARDRTSVYLSTYVASWRGITILSTW